MVKACAFVSGKVRFWIHWQGSPVKLTMKPGDYIKLRSFEPDEEGYHEHCVALHHAGSYIVREGATGGRDCDGKRYLYWEDECWLADLAADLPDPEAAAEDRYPLPAWQNETREVFDEYAQAAGY